MIIIKKTDVGINIKIDTESDMTDMDIFVALGMLEAQVGALFSLPKEDLREFLDETMQDVSVRPNFEEVEVINQ